MEIKSCKSNNDILERLKDEKIFSAYYEALIFAASVGFQTNTRRPIEKTDKTIEIYLFEKFSGFNAVFYGIALAEEKNQDVLRKTDEAQAARYRHFEEYANGGLDVIRRDVVSRPGELLENLLLFMKQAGVGFNSSEGDDPNKTYDFAFGLV